ncbi:MAG: LPP20 family lipoprotein [Selenomonadaceae bacterium]|nr:LPP20 family lipoprotein [Selenomonadaceae bacterium]
MLKVTTGSKIIAALLGVSLAITYPTYAEPTSVSVNVSVAQPESGLDWTKGAESDVIAVGIGLPDERGTAMMREAATLAAQRNLLGIIRGVQIDADTLMENLFITSDIVKRKVSGVLRGAKIVEEGTLADGSYYVKMRVPLYGSTDSLAAAAFANTSYTKEPFPKVENTKLSEAEVEQVRDAGYTGVIIDASGLGLDPTFSPVVYDDSGRAVYGVNNIDADFAIREGMVGYADELTEAEAQSRAGDNPLVIKAEAVSGGQVTVNDVNVVVSEEDADRMLIANEATDIMEDCSVVFVK